MTVTPIRSSEQSFPMDTLTASNSLPLTPSASISSNKSPLTNINNESSLIPIQHHLLSPATSNTAEVNSVSKKYFQDQGYSQTQKVLTGSPANSSPYNFPRLLVDARSSCYMIPTNLIPTNILPTTCSSILPGTIPSRPIPTEVRKNREKRGNSIRKPKVIQNPIEQRETDEKSVPSKAETRDISTVKKRKRKNSHTKDIRTKKQLQRLTRRNQLAVLKFMLRKRKLQKQERVSVPKMPELKAEQVVPKSISTHMAKPENMETNLPDIIAPCLKITFDATQKIESVTLYYHRRRKPDVINESSCKLSNNADNRLGLLLEAVDFIETLHGSSTVALPSVK